MLELRYLTRHLHFRAFAPSIRVPIQDLRPPHPRRLCETLVESHERRVEIDGGGKMQGIRRRELGREVAYQPVGQIEIGATVDMQRAGVSQ